MKPIAAFVAVLVVAASAACTVGPNYKRPIVQVPDAFRGASSGLPAAAAASLADQKWWEVFDDPSLQALIATAVRQNLDVRIAATRVLEAQAQLGITHADQSPTVDAGAGAARERLAQSAGLPALQTYAAQRAGVGRVGAGFLGQVPPRHRGGARAAARERVGPAGRGHDPRQPGGRRVLQAARAGPGARHRAADAHVAAGVAAADRSARAGRRHLAARRAPGRTARLRRGRGDRQPRAADRAAGELHQHAAGEQSRRRSRAAAR